MGCALDGFFSLNVKWIIDVTVVGWGATETAPGRGEE